MGLLERDVRAGNIAVVDGGTVDVRVVVGNLLVVLECLGAVVVLVESKKKRFAIQLTQWSRGQTP